MDRLALRFRDHLVPDTIAEHRAVIDQLGFVWWGWWAKDQEEDLPGDTVDSIRAALNEPIVLYRTDGTSYLAECDDLVVGNRLHPIGSPIPSATPRYYRHKRVRGWFRLKSIRAARPDEISHVIGSRLPSSQTLHWGDHVLLSAPRTDDIRILRSPTVLHLSDLHLGEEYAFGAASASSRGIRVPSLDSHLARALKARSQTIGIVVISGDLISASEAAWQDVSIFLEALLSELGLTPQDLVVVPGNRDFYADEPTAHSYDLDNAHESGFRSWYAEFTELPGRPVEQVVRYQSDDRELTFLQLNSARYNGPASLRDGFVGRDAYADLLTSLGQPSEKETRIAVMHHHLRPVDDNPNMTAPGPSISDATEIVHELQRAGVKVVLHGHGHSDSVQPAGKLGRDGVGSQTGHLEPFWLLGCGSSGAQQTLLAEKSRRNCAMLYDFSAVTHIAGECLEYTTTAPPTTAYPFEALLYAWGDVHRMRSRH